MGDNIIEKLDARPDGSESEHKMKTGILRIDLDACTSCGDCVEWCPTGAVKLVNGKPIVVRPENCNYCTDCETVCLSGAIRCPFEIILVTTGSEPEGKK